MRIYTKEEMDRMTEEAFEIDEIEESIDLGFNPIDVIAGDEEAVAKFKQLRAAAKAARDK